MDKLGKTKKKKTISLLVINLVKKPIPLLMYEYHLMLYDENITFNGHLYKDVHINY